MKPLILIDARFWNSNNGGLAKYSQGLIYHLSQLKESDKFRFIVLTYNSHPDLASNFQIITTLTKHYSLQEQFLFWLIKKHKPNLIHYLHFNHPLINFSPFIVTIHDMIKDFFPQPIDTSHSLFLFKVKRWAYHLVFRHALVKSKKIITPSQTVKNQISAFYPQLRSKIIPIYEGVYFRTTTSQPPTKTNLPPRYLLYVGSLYQHKNVGFLVKNIDLLRKLNLDLIIVSPKEINSHWRRKFSQKKILFFHSLNEENLIYLYQHTYAFISASLMEGFGLPVVEALSFAKPAILTNIPAFKEITHQQMIYFSPNSSESLRLAIKKLKESYNFYVKISQNLANYYSFHATAVKTYNLYQELLSQQ